MPHYYRVETIVPASNPPVPLAFVKQFARVSSSVDDAIIQSFILLATEQAEKYLNRAIGTQTIQMTIAHSHIPQTQSSVGNNGYGLGWNIYGYGFGFQHHREVSLLYGPVQQLVSVSRGYWGQYPDTVLIYGTDYVCDLASNPARVKFLFPSTTQDICGIDHTSILYVAGYGSTNLITIQGTATAAESLTMTVGGQAVSVAVAVGDTAQTVTGNAQAAIVAMPGTPSAAVLSNGSIIQLRADNVAVAVGTVPAGLTVTAGTPSSAVPQALINAITYLAAHLYQNMGDGMAGAPEWFYSMLENYRYKVFG